MKPTAPPSPPPNNAATPPAGMPLAKGWALLLLNWLVPGLGYWICGRRSRGIIQCLMVVITILIGVRLHGGVDWPSWSIDAPDFNLINNFTFIIQLGAGIPALLSLFADKLHLGFLASLPKQPYYELGQYYIIVAGAVNYFATCNLHDRIVQPQTRYAVQEGLEEPAATEES